MSMQIRAQFQRLVADGQIDRQDVGKLIDNAKDWGIVTRGEKETLRALLEDPANADKFSAEAKLDLQRFLGISPPSTGSTTPSTPGTTSVASGSLGQTPSGDAVFFKGGFFVAKSDAPLPSKPTEVGDSLFMVASLIAASDPKTNVFAGLDTAQKGQLFATLQQALQQVPPDIGLPAGYDNAMQAKQQRASVATTMLELMRSMDSSDPEQRLLQDSVLKSYAAMAKAETSSPLRDSMVFQLHNNKDCLVTTEQRAISDDAMNAFAPTKPPYDEWFKDGNDTLKVVCHTGGEFFESEIKRWKGYGFSEVAQGSNSSKTILQKTFERNGVSTKVRLTMMRGSTGTFDQMNDPDTHIVAYSGHSGWGKNIPSALRRAPEEEGKKLVLVNQCCGRGIINKFRDHYPDSQLITTRNSSFEREDFATFKKTIEGIALRRSWAAISNDIRDDHYSNSRDNYYFPNDAQLRMRARDRDHDGIQDIVDRLVNFNTFEVEVDSHNEFTAHKHHKPVDQLEGTKVHEATQIVNTTTKFSDFLENYGTGESYVAKGYYQAQSDKDPMVRITRQDVDGMDSYVVQVNSDYAHASEEAIKAETFYMSAMTPPVKRPHDSALDTTLKGLILVAHSLAIDSGSRDKEIFQALCQYHGLPNDIDVWSVKSCVEMNHVYAGSAASVSKLKEKLGPDLLAKITDAIA